MGDSWNPLELKFQVLLESMLTIFNVKNDLLNGQLIKQNADKNWRKGKVWEVWFKNGQQSDTWRAFIENN